MNQVAEEDITEAIKQFDPENQIEEKEDISGHNNRIYKVRLGYRTVICKFCTGENGSKDCKKEVNMHQILKKRTTVKTPEILYSEPLAENTEFPFFITEYVEGESLQKRFQELDAEKQVEVVEQAGQILGEIHSQISFQHSGELIPENGSIQVKGKSTWIEYITEELSQAVEETENTGFSDLKEKSEETVNRISELKEPEKTLVFYDFRPDNVIYENGKIKALIDFERAWSGDPMWDYAYSEMSFVEPHRYFTMHDPPTSDEEKLQEAFQRGYEEEKELENEWRQRVNLYKTGIIIKRFNSLQDFTEKTDMSQEEVERQEKLLRTNFENLTQYSS